MQGGCSSTDPHPATQYSVPVRVTKAPLFLTKAPLRDALTDRRALNHGHPLFSGQDRILATWHGITSAATEALKPLRALPRRPPQERE